MFPDTRDNTGGGEVGDMVPSSDDDEAPRINAESNLDSLQEPLLPERSPEHEANDHVAAETDHESEVVPPDLETSMSFADFSIAAAATVINSALLPGYQNQLKLPYHLLVTGKLWFVATGLAIAAPNLGDVLDLVGCASGTLIAFVFPAMISLRLVGWNASAVFLLTVGSLVGSVGTFFSVRQLMEDLHI